MESKGLLMGNNNNQFDVDRGMYGAPLNPFLGYHQVKNQYSIPYQFPAASENIYTVGGGTIEHQAFPEPDHGFGLKFGNSGYGNMGTQTHYGSPPMGGKGGKLKGAALSALTLLAFLFFLNLLQSCLKDQMEAMNPTVMVMSAGQRTVIARNEDKEVTKRFDQSYDNPHSDEQQHFNDYTDDGDYDIDDDERSLVTTTTAKSSKRIRGKYKNEKRQKSKSLPSSSTSVSSTIGPKLQNMQRVRSSMEG